MPADASSAQSKRPKWDYEGRVVEALADADARIAALRNAIDAELTHGGIIDRIAHETSIIGAWSGCEPNAENMAKVREAAARLDTARNEFIERMEVALRVVAT